jgi:hypothetical protein
MTGAERFRRWWLKHRKEKPPNEKPMHRRIDRRRARRRNPMSEEMLVAAKRFGSLFKAWVATADRLAEIDSREGTKREALIVRRVLRGHAYAVLAAQAEAAVAVATGEEPIDYMLRIMRDPTVEPARRDAMARAAAPYCHAQLHAVAHKYMNADGPPIAPTINLTITSAAEAAKRLRLTSSGPKSDDAMQ